MKRKNIFALVAALVGFAALALTACLDRTYDNPFISDSGPATDPAWKMDRDGNGIADSVEAYARNCNGTPAECLSLAWENAQASADLAAKKSQDSAATAAKAKDSSVTHADTIAKPIPPKDTVKTPIPPKDTVKVPIPPRDTVRDTVIVPPKAIAAIGIEAQIIYIPMGVQKARPSVSLLPRDAANQGYSLQSLDESTVKVSGVDLVPVKPGSATVRARSDDGGFTTEFQANVLVTDTNRYETEISVAPMLLVADADAQAPAITWKPADVTNRSYTLTSADPGKVLVVMEGGTPKCKPIAAGKADVTLKTLGKGLTAIFTVTVKAAQIVTHPVFSISAEDVGLALGGADVAPKVAYQPLTATNKAYTLKSGNPGVVSVSGSQLHAVGGGSATVTITSVDGPSGTFKATVTVRVQSISAPDLNLANGDSGVIVPVFTPANPDDSAFSMSSNTPETVSVSGNKVQALKNGKAVITLLAADGGIKGSFTVTVTKKGNGGGD